MAKLNGATSTTPWTGTIHTTTNCATCPTQISIGPDLDIQDCDTGDASATTATVKIKTVNGVVFLFLGQGSCD